MSHNGTSRTSGDRLPALIAERDRYQQWMDSLEAERAQIPDHIYERIAADYAERLDRAVEALGAHIESIETRLDERRASLDEVVRTLAAKRDELVETRIRRDIGEFDERRWQSVERSLTSAITEAESRRDGLEAEVRRLEDTLAQVRQPALSSASAAAGDALFLQALAEATGRSTGDDRNGRRSRRDASTVRGAERGDLEAAPSRSRKPTGLRTLRCDACGTFNLPEAMFCEACGGDLPTA